MDGTPGDRVQSTTMGAIERFEDSFRKNVLRGFYVNQEKSVSSQKNQRVIRTRERIDVFPRPIYL